MLDESDSGEFLITLVGGNNDGTDVITKFWQMPNWMNSGDVLWTAAKGYHVPYTIPSNYWSTNQSPIDMYVDYTATNDCTTTPITERLVLNLADAVTPPSPAPAPTPTPECAECDVPGSFVTTLAEANASMVDNGGRHDESPVSDVANTGGGRFWGSLVIMGAQADAGSVPSWHPNYNDYTKDWNRLLPYPIGFTKANHPDNLQAGIAFSPYEVEFLVGGVWQSMGVFNFNLEWADRTVAPFTVVTGYDEWSERRGKCLVAGLNGHQGAPAQVGQGMAIHGYGSFVAIPPNVEQIRVRTLVKRICRYSNGVDDRSLVDIQAGVGADIYANGMVYAPSAGTTRLITVNDQWSLREWKAVIGAWGVDTSGANIGPNHTQTLAQFAASNPDLVLNV